jgi:hypothetical protein
MGRKRNIYKIWEGNPEGNKSLRPGNGYEDNTKIALTEIG